MTKHCVICHKEIQRPKHIADFSWNQVKYCEPGYQGSDCRRIATYITFLEKQGYEVLKPRVTMIVEEI